MKNEILLKLFNKKQSKKQNSKKTTKKNTKKSTKQNSKKLSKKSTKQNSKKPIKQNSKKPTKQNSKKLIQKGGSYKWTTLEHNGVLFPADYSPHNTPLKFRTEYIVLKPEQEEAAMMYAKYIDSDYILNKTFNRNFWGDWKKLLGKDSKIENLEDCDFREYKQILDEEKQIKKNIIEANIVQENESINSNSETHEENNVESEMSRITYNIDAKEEEKYKIAIVDGKPQPVGNYRMEPPGIFLGRGDNPKIGKIKPRVYPEDVTLNLGKEAKIPQTLKNHKWGEIVHDRHAEWLASWKDMITGKTKYLWLGAHSHFKSSSDMEKFDLARKLKRKIEFIRTENNKNLQSDDIRTRQIATAFYFVDMFALRIGGEKGEDTADTVGVTTLRKEHIELLENNTIELDFLGKDSVRYYNKLQVTEEVYKNIIEFLQDKQKDQEIFDLITSSDVNKYLQTFMKDLTAKTFRTYNASYLFQKELKKIINKYDGWKLSKDNSKPENLYLKNSHGSIDINLLIDEYNKANAAVAKKLNHQKNVGKSYKGQVDKMDDQIKKVKSKLRKARKSSGETKADRITKLTDKLKKLKVKKELKQEMKNISLGTSKQNYIDPRISVAFSKKFNIPIDKVFNQALQKKFQWAMETDEEFRF
jgi:DNA topoisomerase-1